jgi:superfamily II DNA or RNA helicase
MSTLDYLRHEGVLSNVHFSVRTMVEEIDYMKVTRLIGDNRSAKFSDSFVTYSILSNLIQDLEDNLVESPIVFVDRVEQAAILSAAFNKLMPDYRSAYIEGRTPKTRRHAILQQFRNGTIHVLFNVNMLREGFDSPNIDGVYLAMVNNPEQTSTKYIQMVGRGLRGTASEGGTESCRVVIIDYSYE